MSTQIPDWPEGLGTVVHDQAGPLAEARFGVSGEEGGSGVRPGEAWPTFHLGADALRHPDAADQAVQTGWRALLHTGGRPALAEVDVSTPVPVVRQVYYGVLAEGVDTIRGRLEDLAPDELGGGAPLEERILSVPAAYFSGLWLHDESDAGRDVVVPIQPVPPGLEEGRRYPFAELCALLAERVVDPPA